MRKGRNKQLKKLEMKLRGRVLQKLKMNYGCISLKKSEKICI